MKKTKSRSYKWLMRAFVIVLTATVALAFSAPETVMAVSKGKVKSITVKNLPAKELTLKKGKTKTLKLKVKKSGKVSTAVTFKSSKPSVATVNSKGKIKAKKKGKANITVTSKANKKKRVTIKVTVGTPVTKVKLNKTTASVIVGESFTLKATVKPKKPSNKKIVWFTSNKSVATVNSKGVVTAKKAGNATITATARDGSGKKSACKVTVKAGSPNAQPRQYTIKFNSNGGSSVANQVVREGQRVVMPTNPTKTGHTFNAWHTSPDLNAKYDFSLPVRNSFNLYAGWTENSKDNKNSEDNKDNKDNEDNEGSIDNLDDDIIDIGDIQVLHESGKIDVIYGDNGEIVSIDGSFTNEKVTSTSDAADVLNSARSLMGEDFSASSSDIQKQEIKDGSNIVTYRFSPNAYSYPVLGSQVVLTTDTAGNVNGLHNTYDNRINNVDTSSELDEEGAKRIALDKLQENENLIPKRSITFENLKNALRFDSKLMIYAADRSKEPVFVYAVNVNTVSGDENAPTGDSENGVDHSESSGEETLEAVEDSKTGKSEEIPIIDITYYIYANSDVGTCGDVYKQIDNIGEWNSITLKSNDLKDKVRSFVGQKENQVYRLKDVGRNLTTYKTEHKGDRSILPGIIATTSNNESKPTIEKTAVSAHANMADVYDFYKTILNRESFDGNGAAIKVSYDYSVNYKNAFWSRQKQQIVFGDSGNYAAALDVAGHEFTHAVINYVVGDGVNTTLTYEGESGALNESYADIMGCLIENKYEDGDWELGEDSADGAIRDLSDPAAHGQSTHYNDRVLGENDDHGGVHTNSGIFNLAAYKMMTDSRTSSIDSTTWANVFYNSLYRLSTSATFLDARGSVICAAKTLGFNHNEQQAIKDAFDAVGIKEPESVRIVLRWGATPDDLDSHIVGPGADDPANRFHVYFSDRTYYNDGEYDSRNSLYAVDLDYDDTTSYGPEVTTIHKLTPGDYYFFVHDYTNQDDENSTAMSLSGATVKIYMGSSNEPKATFNIQGPKAATYWNVCKITIDLNKDISIDPINTFSTSQEYD